MLIILSIRFFFMIIGIDLNDVLRNFTGRLEEIYNKYEIGPEVDLEKNPMSEFNLINTFPFSGGTDELNFFLYIEASLEVFGLGKATSDNIITKLNSFDLDLKDEEEHSLCISSREVNNSIPASLYFLAKNACKIDTIKFHKGYEDLWEGVDVLISANPITLENKPSNKTSIKVNTSYNKTTKADYSIDNLLEFIEDEDLRNDILNNKKIETT